MGLQLDIALVRSFKPIVFEDGVTIDSHQAVLPLDQELKRKPDFRLNLRIHRTLEAIERARGIVSALDVMQLDLVVPAAKSLAARAKQDAAVVVFDMPDVKLEL